MVWDERYAIGVERIDKQHRGLFKAINRVISVLGGEDADRNRVVCAEAVKYLNNYTLEHFADEEAYQTEIQYPGFAAHKKQHVAFTETLLFLERDLEESDYSLAAAKRLEGALMSWLLYHVLNADQAITGKKKSLKEHGDTVGHALAAVLIEALQQIFHDPAEVSTEDYRGDFSGGEIFSILDAGGYRFLLAMEEVPLLRRIGALAGRSLQETDEMATAALHQLGGDITRRALSLMERPDVEIQKNRVLRYAEAKSYFLEHAPICSLLLSIGEGTMLAKVWET